MKASDITTLTSKQFNALSDAELKKALRTMQKAVNQRTSRVKKSGVYSPAVESLKSSGGGIKTTGTTAQMRGELQRAIKFMNMKTSTVKGAREHRKRVIEELGIAKSTPDEVITAAWNEYHKLQEEFSADIMKQVYGNKYADTGHDIVKRIIDGENPNDIRKEIQNAYKNFAAERSANLEDITNGL